MAPSTPQDLLRAAMDEFRRGQMAEASALCELLLRSEPDNVGGLFLLGVARMSAGDDAGAEMQFRRALIVNPAIADAYGNMAVIRLRLGDQAGAARLFDRALALAPNNDGWRVSRSMLRPGKKAQAMLDVKHALVQAPDSAGGWRGLGHARRQAGDPVGAANAFDRALRCEPGFTLSDSEAFSCRLLAADWQGYEQAQQRMLERIDQGHPVLPLLMQCIGVDPARQRTAAARIFQHQVRNVGMPRPTRRAHAADGRMTVAYLSADFHDHATAYLITGLFEQHDRSRFCVLVGCYGHDDGGAMRRRIRASVDGFHDLADLTTDQVAAWAEQVGVDILVDLKGYTAGSRLDLLSKRLAPVQVAYLGYPGTMGGGPVDYLIGDPVVTPAAEQPFYHECLAILPDCYQVNDRRRPLPLAAPDRTDLGLPETGFVFGALHGPQKLNPPIFGCWMRLLHAVPGSCLWLYDPQGAAADNLRREAARACIAPDRLVFAGALPLEAHLARYRAVDLCLDSFPYTGHTTTSDALWMGVPVVTMQGDGFAARVAASLLHAVGLPHLVTLDMAAYEALALTLARDTTRLAELKRHLEQGRHTAPLFDTPRFTAHLEKAFTAMWERHCAGLGPIGFSVTPQT